LAASEEELKRIFDTFDVDLSGQIDKTELFLALDRLGIQVRAADIEQLVRDVHVTNNEKNLSLSSPHPPSLSISLSLSLALSLQVRAADIEQLVCDVHVMTNNSERIEFSIQALFRPYEGPMEAQ